MNRISYYIHLKHMLNQFLTDTLHSVDVFVSGNSVNLQGGDSAHGKAEKRRRTGRSHGEGASSARKAMGNTREKWLT
jgi:hypothetical protein